MCYDTSTSILLSNSTYMRRIVMCYVYSHGFLYSSYPDVLLHTWYVVGRSHLFLALLIIVLKPATIPQKSVFC